MRIAANGYCSTYGSSARVDPTGSIVWGPAGKDADALARFFADLPAGGGDAIETVSMDLGPAYAKTVREHAPNAVICYDPFYPDVVVMPMSLEAGLAGWAIGQMGSA
ncbi:MAG: transposase [Tetrasphaera sp.]